MATGADKTTNDLIPTNDAIDYMLAYAIARITSANSRDAQYDILFNDTMLAPPTRGFCNQYCESIASIA